MTSQYPSAHDRTSMDDRAKDKSELSSLYSTYILTPPHNSMLGQPRNQDWSEQNVMGMIQKQRKVAQGAQWFCANSNLKCPNSRSISQTNCCCWKKKPKKRIEMALSFNHPVKSCSIILPITLWNMNSTKSSKHFNHPLRKWTFIQPLRSCNIIHPSELSIHLIL